VPDNVRRGKAIHRAAELYGKHCRELRVETDWDFGRQLANGLDGGAADDFAFWVENWVWEWSTVRATPIEGHLEATMLDGVTVFSGHPDLVQQIEGGASDFGEGEDLWVVTDFKSHFQGWPDDPPEQLLTYAWMVARAWQGAPSDFRLVIMPLDGGPARSWSVGSDAVRHQGERLQARVDMIAAETEFEANLRSCPGCFYKWSCPLRGTRTWYETAEVPLEEHAGRAQWYRAQADAETDLVKTWCKEHGPLAGLYEPRTSTSLAPKNPATFETDLRHWNMAPTDLRAGYDKTKITRAEKTIRKAEGDESAESFRALLEERDAGTRWVFVAASNGTDEVSPAPEAPG
jgi:hypothetical protein